MIWITWCIRCCSRFSRTRYIPLHFLDRFSSHSVVQLTNDGALKDGLVTDGKNLYFGEHQNSKIVLAAVSTEGGPVRTISTPFVQVVPADISPDGKKLLVLAWEGPEAERALWIVPIAGGQPVQVGKFTAMRQRGLLMDAESPFAAQNAIYVTADEGASIQEIQSFDATPEYLRWSPDGRRLRFDLRDQKTWTASFWESDFQ